MSTYLTQSGALWRQTLLRPLYLNNKVDPSIRMSPGTLLNISNYLHLTLRFRVREATPLPAVPLWHNGEYMRVYCFTQIKCVLECTRLLETDQT